MDQNQIDDAVLKRIWQDTCWNRAFELAVVKAHKAKKLPPAPIYLSIGTEHVPAAVFAALCGPSTRNRVNLFPQHRCHSWLLTFTGRDGELADELLGLRTGCAGGMGGSASLHCQEAQVYGHSGLLGDQVPIAAGMALASQEYTVVVLGDAACEEDYVLATFGFAVSKKLPMLFIVEDNNLSILTETEVRRSWDVVDVTKGFGMEAYNITDSPDVIFNSVRALKTLPALLNINVCRHYWHAGSGQDGPPKWDSYAGFKEWLVELFGADEINLIERLANEHMAEIWRMRGVV